MGSTNLLSCFLLVCCLVSALEADAPISRPSDTPKGFSNNYDSSISSGFGSLSSGYNAPTFSKPSTGYGAPSQTYGTPNYAPRQTYSGPNQPPPAYGVPQQTCGAYYGGNSIPYVGGSVPQNVGYNNDFGSGQNYLSNFGVEGYPSNGGYQY